MSCKTVTIFHDIEGVRFRWPDSTSNTFSTVPLLAEEYARLRESQSASREAAKVVASRIDQLVAMVDANRDLSNIKKVIDALLVEMKALQHTIDGA